MIVVLFQTKLRADADQQEYEKLAERMLELVQQNPGFISINSYPDSDGGELTIVRFASEEALEAWRTHPEHLQVQQLGRTKFYESYHIDVCNLARQREYPQTTPSPTV